MPEHADRIIGLYRRHAEAWIAARRGPPGARPKEAGWLDRMLALLPPRPAVLDLGCGAGEPIAGYLAGHGCDLAGVDSAPELIEVCRARWPEHRWLVADMRSLSLGWRFHAIVAWDSFFHLCFEDQRRMFPILRAHAAPGAALLFTSGPGHGVAMGMFEGEPLYHASLSGAAYRSLLAQNGFEVVAHTAEDPSCGRHTVWLAQLR